MNAPDELLWSRALDEFDALVDLTTTERDAALAALQRESPALAICVKDLLDADRKAAAYPVSATPDENPQAAAAVEWPRVTGYRVLGVLGQGGMGEVFLAEREAEDFVQRVALKRMGFRAGDGAGLHERFLRERRILAQLNHPNIARLLDAGLDADGNPYFAMELVEGVGLTRHAHDKQLDLRARLRLLIVVCEAVANAHRNLIVHRDLKPANVMVDAAGQIKLLDFGIAKLLAPGDSQSTATLSMTPAYAAPEQLLGEPVSTATDVYALGLLLFELLVGHLPERSWRERMRDAVSEHDATERPSTSALQQSAAVVDPTIDPRSRRRLAQQLRGDLDQIILLALRRDPARRYASAQALADDLTRYLAGRPVRARADTWRYRLGKFAARNRWAVSAAMLATLGLIAATVLSLSLARSERSARAVAEAERGKAQLQAQRATRTKDFVVALFSDVDPLNAAGGKGAGYSAVELLDAAALRVNKDLADVPEAQAELRHALAESLRNLGRPQSALPLLDAGIAQLRALGDSARPTLSSALQSRSQVREQLTDLDGAEADAREALAVAMTLPDDAESRLGRIKIRTSLAKQLTLRGNVAEALTQYQAILKDRSALLGSDSDPGLAVDWSNISAVYERLERFADAESSARRAMQLFSAANGASHPRMAWLHNGLAHALLGQERLDESQAELVAARTLALAKLDANNPILININVGLGRVAQARGNYADADAAFSEALRIGTALNHTSLATVEIRNGMSFLQQQRYAEAETMLQRGIERSRKLAVTQANPLVLLGSIGQGLAIAHLDRASEGEAQAIAAFAQLETVVDKSSKSYREGARLLESLRQGRSIE